MPARHGCQVVALIVLAASCLGGRATAAPGSGEMLPSGTLDELATYVDAERRAAGVPGLAYAVIQGDELADLRVLGVKQLGGSDAVDTHTVFEIGSTTKAFTAAMLAMVVEEGKLTWDDRVADHLPSFAMHDRWVTRELRVADLVCQRSGLPGYALDNMQNIGFGRDAIIRAHRFVEPKTSFRSTFAYQNNLWLVAAALIEQKSGFSWEDNLDRRIFGPLGMTSSTTSPEVVGTMPDVATGHFSPDHGSLVPVPPDWPYLHGVDICGPAGAIRSTVLDMAQWLRLHINLGAVGETRLLQATSVAYLHAPKTIIVTGSSPSAEGDVMAYASGWFFQTRRRHPLVWHGGATTGMHSLVGYVPEAGVGMVMLTNTPDNRVPENAFYRLADLVLGLNATTAAPLEVAADRGVPRASHAPRTVDAGPPLPLERYVGTYANPAYGPFEVRVRDGHLEMVLGPNRLVGVLRPVSGNTFDMAWPEWPAIVSTVTFTVPAGRPAEKMTVSLFEDVRGGEFLRAGSGAGH